MSGAAAKPVRCPGHVWDWLEDGYTTARYKCRNCIRQRAVWKSRASDFEIAQAKAGRLGFQRPISPRCRALTLALREAISLLRGYAQSDFDSWTNDEEEFDDPDLAAEDAEAWAAIRALEAVLAGGPWKPEAP